MLARTVLLVGLVASSSACSLARSVTGGPRDAAAPADANLDAWAEAESDADVDARDLPDAEPGTDSGTDAGRPDVLDLQRAGVFTRASEASYWTGAPTNGAAAFLAWAAPDVRRIEDRGDGLGPMLLIEGARTNQILDSRDLASPLWRAGMGLLTPNDGTSPDATMSADRVELPTDSYSNYQEWNPAVGPLVSGSTYVRRRPGSPGDTVHFSLNDMQPALSLPLTDNWLRVSISHPLLAAPNVFFIPFEGRGRGGLTPRGLDYLADLAQLEAGAFPSSAIRAGAAPSERSAETLFVPPESYDEDLRTTGMTFGFAPEYSSADLVAEGPGTTHEIVMFGSDAANGLRLENRGGIVVAHLYAGGGSGGMEVITAPLTWGRGQLLEFVVTPNGLTVTGVGTTASGSRLDWPVAPLRFGGASGTCFGRFTLAARVP